MSLVEEGRLLWRPSPELAEGSEMMRYMRWLERQRGLRFADYESLWRWSVEELEAFWGSIWQFFDIKASQPYETVLADRSMPGARWFPGARLNYAEHALRYGTEDGPALLFQREGAALVSVSWEQLHRDTAALASSLRKLGVGPGDRVAGYLPNIPQAVTAFLACASIGAVWSSCSPDFGAASVLDRFQQIEPKVLFAVDGYTYNGKPFDRRSVVAELQAGLPSLLATVMIPYPDPTADSSPLPGTMQWDAVLAEDAEPVYEQVEFSHPLWILYSSGTTGLPKPIVHGHGGILLEHMKALGLHQNLKRGDTFFWFTTTGWMMWNDLLGGLLLGCTIVLYDGSPARPDMSVLWKLAQDARITAFGASAAYVSSCMKAGIEPGAGLNLSSLQSFGSTGSPLSPEGFEWLYRYVKPDLWVTSLSGGTDVCTAFVLGCPLLPVHAGEIQCRGLGAQVEAFDEAGRSVVGEVGELVITEPLPSMPIYFWNDPEGRRYRESYFEMYPGVWRHGDWVKITPRGSVVIYGRSDATINRQGVRMGSSEIYRVVEELPEVVDSLVIDLQLPNGESYMPLFVVLRPGCELTAELQAEIRSGIREALSARHVPTEILQIPEVPRTLSGKKLEVPVKKILSGVQVERAANPDSLANPAALQFFVQLAQERS